MPYFSFQVDSKVPNAQERQRKRGKIKLPVRENTENLGVLPNHRECLFAQVTNYLFQKVKDIAIFAT